MLRVAIGTAFRVGFTAVEARATDRLVNFALKRFGAKESLFVGDARGFVRQQNQRVQVCGDEVLFYDGPIFNLALANGRCFCGGMMIGLEADSSDGLMDAVCLGGFTRREALQFSLKMYD